MTRPLIVGVGEYLASCDAEACLATYALGSCIAVGMYDPALRIGAMLHFMLPDSAIDRGQAGVRPALFADTGIAALLKSMTAMGAEKSRLKVHLAGGAQMVVAESTLNIGKRNYLAARKNLWRLGVLVAGEAVGGSAARNLVLPIGTGEFVVKTAQSDGRPG